MTASHFESDQFAISRFPLHGHTAVEVSGRLLRVVAQGPFNLELVQAQCRLLGAAGVELPRDRRYLELIEYRHSVLMPRAGWEQLQAFIDAGVQRGFCALATVLVLGPEVEGQALFGEAIERLWSRSRPVSTVTTRAAGEAVLQALLQQHGLSALAPVPGLP